MSEVILEELANGLKVVIQPLPYAHSVAYQLRMPGGIIYDDENLLGTSNLVAGLLERGAGEFDARGLAQAFDSKGILHFESSALESFDLGGACLPTALPEALSLLKLMVQRPTLAQSDIDPVRQLLLFELASLLDNPSRRVINELNRCYYPSPYGRPLEGDAEGLAKITDRDVRDAWQRYFVPDGAVLSVAGNVNPSELLKSVKDLFSDFTGKKVARPTFGSVLTGARDHVPSETAQLQIAIAIPSVGPTDPLYYAARLAVGVLHTGMGGRLFIEVREKRGLCYAVHARMVTTRESGMLRIYAGTTPERAHETLTVIQDELAELASTVTHEELERARTGLKALLVIGDESPQVRSSSNLVDVWIFGRVRSNKEIESALNEITVERVSDYLAAYSVNNATIVTLGSTR